VRGQLKSGADVTRTLVIRTGYTAGLANELTSDISLGAVLRATTLLHVLDRTEVTWVTTERAALLVEGAPNVKRVLRYGADVSLALRQQAYDTVVNLDPSWEFCALAQSVDAGERFGFTLDETGERVVALPGAEALLDVETMRGARRAQARPDEQLFCEVMGHDWHGQPMVLGYSPRSRETFDVGFNRCVGPDRPSKASPERNWRMLRGSLDDTWRTSFDPDGADLADYIEWMNACRIVVTGDTFGLTLALALGKRVVALFGPTGAERCHVHGRGIKLTPQIKLNCIPCGEAECRFGKSCVGTISPGEVAEAVTTLSRVRVPGD
jgi:heptosyltransferase-2